MTLQMGKDRLLAEYYTTLFAALEAKYRRNEQHVATECLSSKKLQELLGIMQLAGLRQTGFVQMRSHPDSTLQQQSKERNFILKSAFLMEETTLA
jgi:hypothetical protein